MCAVTIPSYPHIHTYTYTHENNISERLFKKLLAVVALRVQPI
jgi:hypothetical protein